MGEETVLHGNEFQSGWCQDPSRKERPLDPELTGSRRNVFCGDLLDNLRWLITLYKWHNLARDTSQQEQEYHSGCISDLCMSQDQSLRQTWRAKVIQCPGGDEDPKQLSSIPDGDR